MELTKTVNEFETFLTEEQRTQHTIRAYSYAVRQYLRLFRVFSPDKLNAYKLYLLDHYKPQTVNQRICALNQYMAFMRASPVPEISTAFQSLKELRQIKLQQKFYLENNISDSDFNYLKTQLLRDRNFRWYFIIRFMAATGARVSELIQLKYEHLEAGYMEICSKAGKTRRVLLPKQLCREAMQYYQSHKISSGFIILNKKGNQITPRGINSMLKTFAYRYKINEYTMHPHAFRHLYAQNFLKKCPDLSLLADLLGHDSIETTRIYLKKTGAEQHKLIDKIVTW